MAITAIKIHPAIGVARLGNSPTDFFIGPERPWDHPDPAGGFKDGQCRVKRQAARFRVFAYHDDDSVQELTAADADITWTVHLVNRKAVTRNAGGTVAEKTIDPGARTLNGVNQQALFDNGQITLPSAPVATVPLGEIRTDDDGRLLVLGGFGKSASPGGHPIGGLYSPDWYDDIADGPVTASVTINASGDTFDAVGAWVIVGPPKFAPHVDNVVTLHDRLLQQAVAQGWVAAPASTSYTQDIYPILQRAIDSQWVRGDAQFHHVWTHPLYGANAAVDGMRTAIFNKLKPSGNMPAVVGQLTDTQLAHMARWRDNSFARDWVAAPQPAADITAPGLDLAGLEHCVGEYFAPGIEAGGGGTQPIVVPANFIGASDPMRLDHAAVVPGGITEFMSVPWQSDFSACGGSWWPAPRPGTVIPQGTTTYEAWNRDVTSGTEMVNEWHTLGFVVKQGSEQVEVDRCDSTFINLLTPHLDFQDVPQGPAGMSRKMALPISFEVKSTGGAVTLDLQSGPSHARLVADPFSNPVSVGPTSGNAIVTARLWIVYETGALGEFITDAVTVRHAASGRTWQVTITANTVARLRAAVALALDRSGSMSGDRGDGQPKHLALREAAKIFVDVMVEDDGIGLVRYDQDAQPFQAITDLGAAGDPFDSARNDTKNRIDGPDLDPAGATSIGDGIYEARLLLDAASGYDLKSLVVMTDGVENRARYISEVGAQVDARTYALGLGTPQNTSAAALQTLSGNNGGYLLVTGAIDAQNQFILKKYFLQILAGISNADVVLDPSGMLVPGVVQEIPFQLTEADAGIDVILLTPYPQAVDFRVRTPDGDLIEPWMSGMSPQVSYLSSQGVAYYRLVLPMELRAMRPNQAGTWTALLSIGKPRPRPPQQGVPNTGRVAARVRVEGQSFTPSQAPSDAYVWEAGVAGQTLGADQQQPLYASAARTGDGRRRVLPYSLIVHSYSNLSLRASLDQDGYDLGARMHLQATLAESGMPLRPGANVWAEITQPDRSVRQLPLQETEDGRFQAAFTAEAGGVYHCRIRASGRSRAGYAFQREQTLTAVAWRGGDRDALPPGGDGLIDWLEERDQRLCALLQCLLPKRGAITPEVAKQLQAAGFDLEAARACLKKYCQPKRDQDAHYDGPLPGARRTSAMPVRVVRAASSTETPDRSPPAADSDKGGCGCSD